MAAIFICLSVCCLGVCLIDLPKEKLKKEVQGMSFLANDEDTILYAQQSYPDGSNQKMSSLQRTSTGDSGARPVVLLLNDGCKNSTGTTSVLPAAKIKSKLPDPQRNGEKMTDNLECGVCKQSFHDIILFLTHKSTHKLNGSKHLCLLCEQVFSRQASLIEHYRRKHKISIENIHNKLNTLTTDTNSSGHMPTSHCEREINNTRPTRTINSPKKKRPKLDKYIVDDTLDSEGAENAVDIKIENHYNDPDTVTGAGSMNGIPGGQVYVATICSEQNGLDMEAEDGLGIDSKTSQSSNERNLEVKRCWQKESHMFVNSGNESISTTVASNRKSVALMNSFENPTSHPDTLLYSHSSGHQINEPAVVNYIGSSLNNSPVVKLADGSVIINTSSNQQAEQRINSMESRSSGVTNSTANSQLMDQDLLEPLRNDRFGENTCGTAASMKDDEFSVEKEHSIRVTVGEIETSVRNIERDPDGQGSDYRYSDTCRTSSSEIDNSQAAIPTGKVIILNAANRSVVGDPLYQTQIKQRSLLGTMLTAPDGERKQVGDFTVKVGRSESTNISTSISNGKHANISIEVIEHEYKHEHTQQTVEGTDDFSAQSTDTSSCQRVTTRADAAKFQSFNKDIKTIPQELNMPDFYFIHKIKQLGQGSGNVAGEQPSTCVGRDEFVCILCGDIVNWRRTLCRHMRDKHETELMSGQAVTAPVNYDHIQGNVLKMSDFVEVMGGYVNRLRHVEKQDLPGVHPCDKCDKVFDRLRYLRKHQVLHKTGGDFFLCTVCIKTFRTAAYLKQHMKTHVKEREAYKCNQCDFTSTVNIAIHNHRQLHTGNSIVCEVCGSAYTDKSTLTKHMKVHDPARPFHCAFPGCTWKFHTQAMCNAHNKTHTSKGKFVCDVCGYAFRKKHHLQRHELVVHKIIVDRQPEPRNYGGNKEPTVQYNNATSTHARGIQLELQSELVIDENTGDQVVTDGDQFDLETALQNGQLVIATGDNSAMSYEMSDMNTGIVYQTLLQDSDGNHLDTRAILLPEASQENQLDSQTILLPENCQPGQLDSQTMLLAEGADSHGNQLDSATILYPDGGQILYQHDAMSDIVHTEVEINNEEIS